MGASLTGVGWWLQVAVPGVRAPSGLAPFGAQTPEERLAYGGPAGRRVGAVLQSPAVCGPVGRVHDFGLAPKVRERKTHKSVGFNPVRLLMRCSMTGPISSLSWNANKKSG